MVQKFDAVVIGSGFGGSVTAEKLSAAGMSVCLLERGNIYPPGSFARSPHEIKNAFWDPSNKLYGLFNIWSFNDTDVVVASGLGGGSLIYANVLIEKPSEWFDGWPISYNTISSHYAKVKSVLNPAKYPYTDQTLKTQAMAEASHSTGLELVPLDLAITFGNDPNNPIPGEQLHDPGNMHESLRFACRLCGECYLGCNYGSKNTLDFNYLSKAKLNHTDIRELCEVKEFGPASDGTYDVSYVKHDPTDPDSKQIGQLNCKYLVLAAGTLGSTYLLLKNKRSFPNVSPRLGHNYSGNGDLKAIAIGCKTDEQSRSKRNMDPSYGPVITMALKSDVHDQKDSHFLIEDWSYPSSLLWMLEAFYSPLAFIQWSEVLREYLQGQIIPGTNPQLGSSISDLLNRADRLSSSFPMVGMGMDASNGVMTLEGRKKHLQIKFSNDDSREYYQNVYDAMQTIRRNFNADRLSKLLSWEFLEKSISVHPLGGCSMGTSKANGVVNDLGEVFGYPGFFIVDGSVIPSAVGVNPALTIAALSDRFSDEIVRSWSAS